MHRALNLKDLQTAHDQRQPIIVQSVEGAQFIEGRLDRVEEAYNRGLRHRNSFTSGMTWSCPSAMYTRPPLIWED